MSLLLKKIVAVFFVGILLVNGVSYVFGETVAERDAALKAQGGQQVEIGGGTATTGTSEKSYATGEAAAPTTTNDPAKNLAVTGGSKLSAKKCGIDTTLGIVCTTWIVFATPAITAINMGLALLSFIGSKLDTIIKFPLVQVTVITDLWQIVRDFVNIGFVVAMIIIAYATMLGIESYGYRQSLLKLVMGALLINFSLVFIGFFLDINAIGSTFMLSQITQGSNKSDVGDTSLDKLLFNLSGASLITGKPTGLKNASETEVSITSMVALVDIYAKAVFIWYMAACFAALIILMIARLGYLANLIITSPLIWLQNVFQGTRGGWSNWWTSFWTWCFLPVFTLFYFYIAVEIYAIISNGGKWTAEGGVLDSIFAMVVVAVTISTLMAIAMKSAFEHSEMASEAVVKLTTTLHGTARNASGKIGLGKMLQRLGENQVQSGLKKRGIVGGSFGELQRRVGQSLQNAGATSEEPYKKAATEKAKRADNETLRANAFTALQKPPGALSGRAQIEAQTWINEAAQKGLLNNLSADQMKNLYTIFGKGVTSEEKQTNQSTFLKATDGGKADEVNKFIQSGALEKDTGTSMKLAAKLAEKKTLDDTTLNAMGLNDLRENKRMREDYEQEYEKITKANLMYHQDILASGGSSDAVADKLLTMSEADRSSIDMKHLTNSDSGSEGISKSSGVVIPQLGRKREDFTSYLDKVRTKATASRQNLRDYMITNHKGTYNAIAKKSHIYDRYDPRVTGWKPVK